jgi:periplasmic protein TonB
MFEDSTFESTGRIHTHSRNWMIASSGFNGSILLALVLIPLLYPHALPPLVLPFLMEVPRAPAPEPKPETQVQHVDLAKLEIRGGQIFAPPAIPIGIKMVQSPETLPSLNVATMDDGSGSSVDNLFGRENQRPVVSARLAGPVRVSGTIVAGLLIEKRIPIYPPIAKATGTQGTVVLQATISRSGSIENLHVVSGPGMLQQAAMDAVKEWHYRPYLLSGEPVEVETTVNVVFKLQD